MNIGFIDMGIMGSRMTMNLLEEGNDLTISSRIWEKSQVLLAKDTSGGNGEENNEKK